MNPIPYRAAAMVAVVAVGTVAAVVLNPSIRVIDGDTFDRGGERIRLANIDAPELHAGCRGERETAWEARQAVAYWLRYGRDIDIHRRGTDRYGRTLAVVYVDGRDIGESLVKAGLARRWLPVAPKVERDWC